MEINLDAPQISFNIDITITVSKVTSTDSDKLTDCRDSAFEMSFVYIKCEITRPPKEATKIPSQRR